MYVLPPAANPLVPATDSDWLLPIRFGIKPYLELCHAFDLALAELEARYPARRRLLTISARNKRFGRRSRKRK
jgi:hypothetical protein